MFVEMKQSEAKAIQMLRDVSSKFDDESTNAKKKWIKQLSTAKLPGIKLLVEYVDALHFILAHPENEVTVRLVEKELSRVSSELRKMKSAQSAGLVNTGLPWMKIHTRFSHDCITWMLPRKDIRVRIESYTEPTIQLIEALKLTLPAVEREYTTTGMDNDELMNEMLVDESQRLKFIADQLSELNHQPLVKDFIFDGLDIHVEVKPTTKQFSKIYNRINRGETYYHQDLLKKFDHVALLNTALPAPHSMSAAERNACADVLKITMTLNARETDPTTFMDESSLRLYHLERGISVAIFGMTPARQLPVESYVGFTLFKNGLPASYGGGWVFGRRSLFGINILEAFRGGESGYVMCQILRVYRQAFNVDYFEVEPYQYGADNPDGIKSGAFWFYYRYGFRPLDKTLLKLSQVESKRIQTTKGYRTSEKVLLRFTHGNIALNLGAGLPPTVSECVLKFTSLIQKKYHSDRKRATEELTKLFLEKVSERSVFNHDEKRVMTEVAFQAAIIKNISSRQVNVLLQMVFEKPRDLYGYQKLLLLLY